MLSDEWNSQSMVIENHWEDEVTEEPIWEDDTMELWNLDLSQMSPVKQRRPGVQKVQKRKRCRKEVTLDNIVEGASVEVENEQEVAFQDVQELIFPDGGHHLDQVMVGEDVTMQETGRKSALEAEKDQSWESENTGSFEDACQAYAQGVQAHCAGFYQIGEGLCVAGAWDFKKQQGKAGWFHVSFRQVGPELLLNCRCSRCRAGASSCIHKWFLVEYRQEWFPEQEWEIITNKAVMITREQTDSENWHNVFSVGLEKEPSRAIVTHNGKDDGGGRWTCSKTCADVASCPHIGKARAMLPRLVSGDPNAEEGSGLAYMGFDVERGKHQSCAISHLPIRPPPWVALSSDLALYPYPKPVLSSPGLIRLDEYSACPYHAEKVFWDGTGEVTENPCVVYTIVGAFEATVQLVKCPICPGRRRRYIGPDPRDLGLFNFNN
ncbi:hypothetical protein C8J56DRAFT_1133967 [Mycena floridula]|nr:hypothetical protein C8J56DRAFT_1133967 [Mycena floridula]